MENCGPEYPYIRGFSIRQNKNNLTGLEFHCTKDNENVAGKTITVNSAEYSNDDVKSSKVFCPIDKYITGFSIVGPYVPTDTPWVGALTMGLYCNPKTLANVGNNSNKETVLLLAKPDTLVPKIENIPEELKSKPPWGCVEGVAVGWNWDGETVWIGSPICKEI